MRAAWGIVVLICMASSVAHAQALTARQILENAARNYDAVQDYTVNARLKVDSPDIHVPEMTLKIFFKKPNKVHVESEDGFAVLPKQGIVMGNPIREAMADAKLSLAGSEKVDGIRCHVVKASYEREGRGVDSTIWVDARRWIVLRMNANPDWGPSVKIKLWYTKVAGKYWLPSRSYANVTIPPLPHSQAEKKPVPTKPTVIDMRFTGYRVNTGLSDSIFEERNGSR